jgi:hypothetical protein
MDEEYDLHNSTSEEEFDEEIDTFKVSREIVQRLKTHAISHFFFASSKLGISPVYFDDLVNNTKSWKDLHKSQRKIFKKIEKWTDAKSEEIEALKQDNLVYKLKMNIFGQNFRKKKASDQQSVAKDLS